MASVDSSSGDSPALVKQGQQDFSHEEGGLHKGLKNRQVQMIAVGGAIGTGLFLGAGGRLVTAGPGLFIVYGICGFFVFLMLRALGELVLHRPSSGSFVSYAREFYGEKAAFVAGWMYFFNWAMTAIVDITAIATYMQFWGAFSSTPQWLMALIALVVVLSLNLVSVKIFGEMEFWFALIKVIALTAFLVIGTVFLAGRFPIEGETTGLSVISDNGGWFPTGAVPLIVVVSGVIFAYAAVELVGTAAGETENPEKIMPRAINTVIIRIVVFYCGSLILLGLLLPYTAYDKDTSPFVTFFSKIGVPGAGDVMNFVVLTSALSSLNAGLYSTGRIARSMSMNGSAPQFMSKLNKGGVPYGGILATGAIAVLGVVLNAVAPGEAFEIVLNASALGIIASWGTIVLCQLRLYSWSKKGIVDRPEYRLFGAPYTGYMVIAFLVAVLGIMAYDEESRPTVYALGVVIPLLVIGWFLVRKRVLAAAEERMGYTGEFPVKANRPPRDT